jgi:hypothetical protein
MWKFGREYVQWGNYTAIRRRRQGLLFCFSPTAGGIGSSKRIAVLSAERRPSSKPMMPLAVGRQLARWMRNVRARALEAAGALESQKTEGDASFERRGAARVLYDEAKAKFNAERHEKV